MGQSTTFHNLSILTSFARFARFADLGSARLSPGNKVYMHA